MSDLTLSLSTDVVALRPEPKVAHPPRQLLTPLPTPGHFLLVIDNSSLEVFTTCPKAADYKLVRRREAHARNAALTFGGAIHEGLEKFLHHQWSQQNAPAHINLRTIDWDALQDQAVVRFFTENPAPLDDFRTVQNALAVLAAYRQRAALPDYNWEIQSDASGPIIERAFELPLGVLEVNSFVKGFYGTEQDKHDLLNLGMDVDRTWVSQIHLAWSGRIDAITRCGDPNICRVVDHKTGKVDPMEYTISNPVLGYVWAARQLWPELDVRGFCLNAISTKKPAAGCSMTSPGPRGGKPALELFRSYFEYSDERLAQWEENTRAIVSDFVHNLVRDFHPRHTKWCFGKYGRCQYWDVCTQDDPRVRANMLNSDMFRGVTWNPVAP